MSFDIQSLAPPPVPDPTEVVVWNNSVATVDAIAPHTAGDQLALFNDQLHASLALRPGIHGGTVIGSDGGGGIHIQPGVVATAINPEAGEIQLANNLGNIALRIHDGADGGFELRSDGVGLGHIGATVSDEITIAPGGLGGFTFALGGVSRFNATNTQIAVTRAAAAPFVIYNSGGADERWRISPSELLGQPNAAPGDAAANPSPTITLRQVIDPLGAPPPQNVDAVNQHVNIAIGAGGVAQTLWQFRVNGVQGLGIFWDEATGQCALEVPAWNTAITPPFRNGQLVFDVLNPGGFSFYGSVAGLWRGMV
jgi:hypothetical protein